MKAFKGFDNAESFTELPDTLFRELLGQIDDVNELKVVLLTLWSTQHGDASFPALRRADFDETALSLTADEIRTGLEHAVQRGVVLRSAYGDDVLYFPNSPRGRAAAQAFARGGRTGVEGVVSARLDRPNVFKLYEENIGPLTPLIADALKDAEDTYSDQWTADAIELAVKHNKRSWKYCEAILKRWKEEGRGKKQNRRDDQAARQRDVEEKIRKFLKG
jgi:DNA replication protein